MPLWGPPRGSSTDGPLGRVGAGTAVRQHASLRLPNGLPGCPAWLQVPYGDKAAFFRIDEIQGPHRIRCASSACSTRLQQAAQPAPPGRCKAWRRFACAAPCARQAGARCRGWRAEPAAPAVPCRARLERFNLFWQAQGLTLPANSSLEVASSEHLLFTLSCRARCSTGRLPACLGGQLGGLRAGLPRLTWRPRCCSRPLARPRCRLASVWRSGLGGDCHECRRERGWVGGWVRTAFVGWLRWGVPT